MATGVRRREAGFTLIELMIVVAITGILASVAIPAYVKYIRRASTTEAAMNLRVMYDGAVSYYIGEHSDTVGAVLARQFPNSAPPTPAAVPHGSKHNPTPVEFETPEWMALNFAVRDPYWYQYSFNRDAAGPNTASMIAQGDLDGDNIYSLFMRTCSGTPEGVSGGTVMSSINEIE
jgi:prepilin-type N-terminal cleavage/methylation domain-containing protein